jgi:predicted transcriptional regulator
VTHKLWALLRGRSGLWYSAELQRELHCSKTALLSAIYELDELGLVSMEVEDNEYGDGDSEG